MPSICVQGQALDQFAKKSVRVLVVGNPANTNALICSQYAPTIPKENFSAMTRLDQNRAQVKLAVIYKLVDPVRLDFLMLLMYYCYLNSVETVSFYFSVE